MTEHSEPRRWTLSLRPRDRACVREKVDVREDKATEADVEAVAAWLARKEAHRDNAWKTASADLQGIYRLQARLLLSTVFKEGGEG